MGQVTGSERQAAVIAAMLASVYFLAEIAGLDGGAAQIALKGSAVAVLAVAAAAAARTRDGWLLTAVMTLGALGDVLIEFYMIAGAGAFAAGHAVAIALYLSYRRPGPLPMSQQAAAGALLITAPLLWLLAGDAKDAGIALYAALLCAMAASAWTSRFPRYRTGVGALLFVVSDAFILARLGGNVDPALAELLIWPLYAAGQILIFIGVHRTLKAA